MDLGRLLAKLVELPPLPPTARFAVAVAQWNPSVTNRLLDGALGKFAECGVDSQRVDVVRVPGSWELPVAVQLLAHRKLYVALIALGAVIKGETTHDEFINRGVSEGLMRIALEHRLPVLCGVLTCQSMEQALQRAGGAVGDKGAECAEGAIEMARLAGAIAGLD